MKKLIIITVIIIFGLIVIIFVRTPRGWQANLVSPVLNQFGSAQKSQVKPQASPNIKAPKSFQYDSSTDLKAELEKVNPQVLDSDFE